MKMLYKIILFSFVIMISSLCSCTVIDINHYSNNNATTSSVNTGQSQTSNNSDVLTPQSTENKSSISVIYSIIWGVLGFIGIIMIAFSFTLNKKTKKGFILAIGLFLLAISIFYLSTIDTDFANGLTLLATLGAVFMALMSLKQTEDLEKRHEKETVLKELADWAVEIQNIPWSQSIPTQIKGSGKLSDVDLIASYASVLTKNDYFKKLSEKAFGGQLKNDVDTVIETLIIFLYLKWKNLGVQEPGKIFGGTFNTIVLSFDERMKGNNKPTSELISEYGHYLPAYTNKLIMKIADIKANLLE